MTIDNFMNRIDACKQARRAYAGWSAEKAVLEANIYDFGFAAMSIVQIEGGRLDWWNSSGLEEDLIFVAMYLDWLGVE